MVKHTLARPDGARDSAGAKLQVMGPGTLVMGPGPHRPPPGYGPDAATHCGEAF